MNFNQFNRFSHPMTLRRGALLPVDRRLRTDPRRTDLPSTGPVVKRRPVRSSSASSSLCAEN